MRKKNAIAPTDEEILAYNRVPPEVAALYIEMSTPTLYSALQQQRASFGFAVQNLDTGTWTYNISPGGLVKYKHEGCPVIRLGELREMMADSAKEVLDAKMQSLNRVIEVVMGA